MNLIPKNVSAQNRPRLYWTNIDFGNIPDLNITLSDVCEKDVDEKYYLTDKAKVYITQKIG